MNEELISIIASVITCGLLIMVSLVAIVLGVGGAFLLLRLKRGKAIVTNQVHVERGHCGKCGAEYQYTHYENGSVGRCPNYTHWDGLMEERHDNYFRDAK